MPSVCPKPKPKNTPNHTGIKILKSFRLTPGEYREIGKIISPLDKLKNNAKQSEDLLRGYTS